MKKSALILVAVVSAIFLTCVASGEQSKSQPVSKAVSAIPPKVLAEYKQAQQGEVQIHLNGGKDQAIIGATNTLEIWIGNGAPLVGMSLGFEVKSQAQVAGGISLAAAVRQRTQKRPVDQGRTGRRRQV